MMMPSIFRDNLFDDLLDGFSRSSTTLNNFRTVASAMRTDVRELDDKYELDIDLPGVKKEDVTAELYDGYLTIRAKHGSHSEEKDKDGKYLCKERYCGSASRSFYVGKDVKQEEIKAKFDNGILKLTVPKPDKNHEIEENKYISIE